MTVLLMLSFLLAIFALVVLYHASRPAWPGFFEQHLGQVGAMLLAMGALIISIGSAGGVFMGAALGFPFWGIFGSWLFGGIAPVLIFYFLL